MEKQERILQCDNTTRRIIFPIPQENQIFWDMYEQHRDLDWRVNEIDLAQDLKDWDHLNDNEKHFIVQVLAFFAASDGIVNESVISKLYMEVGLPEIRAFYAFQSHIEMVHAHMYSEMINVYTKNYPAVERDRIFNALDNIDTIGKKGNFAINIIESDSFSFVEALVYQLIVEGVFFSASFCAIYWIKKSGMMPGLTQSNELISRDEGMHCEFAVAVYKNLNHRLSQDQIYSMFEQAVNIEKDFVHDSLPVKLIGMDADQMCQYVEFVADYWIKNLGYESLFKATNPFSWMELISVERKTNFFEHRVTEYIRPGGTIDESEEF